MPTTRIQDVIIPEIFVPYVIRRTAELSALVEAGIVLQNEQLDQLVAGGGATINMPFWNDLAGADQILSDNRALEPQNITAGQDVAVINYRGNAWSSNQLAGAMAGSDPMQAIGELVARWWARREQAQLIAELAGVFAAPTMADHVLDASAQNLTADLVLDAKQLLGDAAGQLSGIAMNSIDFTALQKQNLIAYIPNARGEVVIPTYLGYQVIVDDAIPYTPGTPAQGETAAVPGSAALFLFAEGAFARGEGVPPGTFTSVETDRDVLAGNDVLVHNRAYVLHPLGIKWVGQPANTADSSPANTDFAIGTNWSRVYASKQVGLVKLIHAIGA